MTSVETFSFNKVILINSFLFSAGAAGKKAAFGKAGGAAGFKKAAAGKKAGFAAAAGAKGGKFGMFFRITFCFLFKTKSPILS